MFARSQNQLRSGAQNVHARYRLRLWTAEIQIMLTLLLSVPKLAAG